MLSILIKINIHQVGNNLIFKKLKNLLFHGNLTQQSKTKVSQHPPEEKLIPKSKLPQATLTVVGEATRGAFSGTDSQSSLCLLPRQGECSMQNFPSQPLRWIALCITYGTGKELVVVAAYCDAEPCVWRKSFAFPLCSKKVAHSPAKFASNKLSENSRDYLWRGRPGGSLLVECTNNFGFKKAFPTDYDVAVSRFFVRRNAALCD